MTKIEEVLGKEKLAENMRIWDLVFDTDPLYTSKVRNRGGFTAIDAYYRIQKATQLWGPVGHRWAIIPEKFEILGKMVICFVRIDYPSSDSTSKDCSVYGVSGCEYETVSRTGETRTDNDAYKKALTDASTKALSYLGFSADVFLGQFDDNKYVEEQAVKYKRVNTNEATKALSAMVAEDDFGL